MFFLRTGFKVSFGLLDGFFGLDMDHFIGLVWFFHWIGSGHSLDRFGFSSDQISCFIGLVL